MIMKFNKCYVDIRILLNCCKLASYNFYFYFVNVSFWLHAAKGNSVRKISQYAYQPWYYFPVLKRPYK